MKVKFIVIIIFYAFSSLAQRSTIPIYYKPPAINLPDTLPKMQKKSKAKFLLSFDNYRSFIAERPVQFYGLKLGIEWPRKFRWGFGLYSMKNGLPLAPIERRDYSINQKFNFAYVNTYFEYVIYEDYRWEFSVPVSIGTGWGNIDTISSLYNKPGIRHSDTVTVFTQGIAAHYKVFYWLGVGVGGGYREIITKDKFVQRQLNGPFYAIKIKLFLGGLYKAIFKRNQVYEERDEYRQHMKDKKYERIRKREKKRKEKQ